MNLSMILKKLFLMNNYFQFLMLLGLLTLPILLFQVIYLNFGPKRRSNNSNLKLSITFGMSRTCLRLELIRLSEDVYQMRKSNVFWS